MPVLLSTSTTLMQVDTVIQTWCLLVLKSDRLYLETVCGLLREAFPHSVVAEACSLAEAQPVLKEGPVDLVLSGLTSIGDEPMVVLREWRNQGQVRRIVLISGRKEPQVLLDAMALPVDGIFDAQHEGLVALVIAVRLVMSGERYFSSSVQLALTKLSEASLRLDRMLTPAEQRVFAVIGGEGASDDQAAVRLQLRPHTIRKHRESLHRKLNVSTK